MARTPSLAQPPALAAKPGDRTLIYDLELLTPLCGGGVTPGQNDTSLLVRGTAIRGHLRFWWRACRAGEFGSAASLREKENELWGSTSKPAAINLRVEITRKGEAGKAIVAFSDDVVPAYVAFPLTSNQQGQAREKVAFRLTLSFPDRFRRDVEAAVWAWVTFGGLGARTRRGFGALNWKGSPASVNTIRERLLDDEYVAQRVAPEEGIPSLYGAKLAVTKEAGDNPYVGWYDGIDKLKGFRQARRKGSQANRPGRSYWGDADAIRRVANQRSPLHNELLNIPVYPRAVFGLPIIFQFVNPRNTPDRERDPGRHTLQGPGADRDSKGINRLASPIIIRPIQTADEACFGMAVRLANTFHSMDGLVPGGLKLQGRSVAHCLSSDQVARIKTQANLPKALTFLKPDVLDGFMEWFAD